MEIRKITEEEVRMLDKICECGQQGHGELVIDPDGCVTCRECGECLDCISPEAVEEQKALLAELSEITPEERASMERRAEQRAKCRERGHGGAVLKPGDIVVCRDCGIDLYQEEEFERGESVDLGSLYPDLD